MERRFVKSGIPGLDDILGGGLLEGSVITLSGPTGSGKSTFAAQFIYNGIVESEEPGLYISIEESKKDFFFHMSGYNWDFPAVERDRKFILLDYPIHEVDQIVEQSSAIQEIINSTGARRVVIDSIMPIALFFKGEDERKTGFLKFIDNLRRWGTTTMIVSEDTKMGHAGMSPSSQYGIESFSDGWINLFFKYDEETMTRWRYAEVIKMKGVEHSSKAYRATLDNDGFKILSGDGKPAKSALGALPPSKPAARAPPKAAAPQKKTLQKTALPPAKMSPALAAKLEEAKKRLKKR
ncbi:MAG: ATPase domain-containing protein [Candidatus Micrarchaeota archaeon]